MRGRKSKYYDYISASSIGSMQELNGRDDLLAFRPYLTGMTGTVNAEGKGDYLCLPKYDLMHRDNSGRYHFSTPDVIAINDLRSRLERETKNARRFVEKAFSKFVMLSEDEKIPHMLWDRVVSPLFEDHDQMLKRRRGLDTQKERRLAWNTKNHPDLKLSERDWLLGKDPGVMLYNKMEMHEFKQYAYVLRMHKYVMKKFADVVDNLHKLAHKLDFGNEFEDFIVDEFNRLIVQTRQEQERRIK